MSADVKPDFKIRDEGSIMILWALSNAAKEWVEEHIPSDAQLWGRNGIVVEPRYMRPIVEGFQNDGLSL